METTTKNSVNKITKIIISIIIILILLDQLSKIIIANFGEIIVISNIFKLSIVEENSNSDIFTLIVQHVIVLGVIIKFIMSQNQFMETKMKVFLSLILSGGISNFIDIIIRGNIVNFINIKLGSIILPILNIAYICIIIGTILIVANFAIFTVKEMRNKKGEQIQS